MTDQTESQRLKAEADAAYAAAWKAACDAACDAADAEEAAYAAWAAADAAADAERAAWEAAYAAARKAARAARDAARDAEGQGEQLSKTKALNILRKDLMNSSEYMKCENSEEFKHRLQWLSEGMLKNHMTNGKSTVINSEEIKLYQEYRKKREQIQRGLTQGVAAREAEGEK